MGAQVALTVNSGSDWAVLSEDPCGYLHVCDVTVRCVVMYLMWMGKQ